MSQTESNTLSGITIFADLSADEIKQLEKTCRWKIYAARKQIVGGETETRSVFLIVHGAVRVVDYSMLGQEVTFDDLSAGAHFGEMAAIDGKPRSANVIALTESLIASMPAEVFRDVLTNHPEVALRVISEMSRVVRDADARIMDLSTLGASSRVCSELLRQAMSVAEDPDKATIRPIPVHGDIASRISTTRETVARAMSDLARQGVVERTKDALLINDLEGLRAMVEGDRNRDRRSGQSRRSDTRKSADTERRALSDRRARAQ